MSSSVVVRPEEAFENGPPGARPSGFRRLRAVPRSGWVPTVLVVIATVEVLRLYAVPAATTAVFLGYICAGVALPGTLVYRAIQRRSGWFVGDVAAGTALGYAGEVLTYIPARALGAPLLVLLWPGVVIALFAAVPGLRRYWRGSGDPAQRTPIWVAWSLSAAFGILVYWSSTGFFRTQGLYWPSMGAPDADSPFHLALIGEAKHHMPMMSPWVTHEPVYYHWFVYAEMAATSWVTGIEPQVLLLRLSLLPFIATFLVLMAVLGRRLTGTWWAAPVAATATFFVLAPNPYPWSLSGWFSAFATSPYDDGSVFRKVMWTSPTQTFGQMLFAACMLALVGLLKRDRLGARQWILWTVMILAVMGGKATFLPMLLAALLLVVAVHLVAHRRLHRPALIASGITFVCVLFAQFVLFGGASQGLAISPLHQMTISGGSYTTGFAVPGHHASLKRLLLVLALTLLCWAFVWAGIAGLAGRRRYLDPVVVVLIGVGLAGIGGILLFGDDGGAEGWFLNSSRPYLTLAAVVGAVAVTRVSRMTWRVGGALAGSTLLGALIVAALRHFSLARVPTARRVGGNRQVAWALTWPYLLLVLAVVVFAAAVFLVRRRWSTLQGLAPTLVLSLVAGMGLFATANLLLDNARLVSTAGWHNVVAIPPFITEGTMETGRWLRDHSQPNDLVATNAHCVPYPDDPATACDNRHFYFSAYSERRFLLEGWGFTNDTHVSGKATNTNIVYAPYWDPRILADNDAAFARPSAQTIGLLRDKYHVKWLWVDDTENVPSPDLSKYATLRFRSGDCAVYEINA
ncbi:MAG TPA: hypothetical protein VGJ07_06920 [Rugosimonospora sp.]